MESETPAHLGLGYSIDTRTVEMIGAIELRVCEEEQISNSCTIADVNRPNKSMDAYPKVAKPPNVIRGTQPTFEAVVKPKKGSPRTGLFMVDTGAAFTMVTKSFADYHSLPITAWKSTFRQADSSLGNIIGVVSFTL